MKFKRGILSIVLIWLSTNCQAQHVYGSFYSGDMYVNYIKAENRTEKAAIVMIPGANLSSYIYVATPDGRKGWAEMFADQGYDVYMVNDPRYDFATGGFIAPYTIPANGKDSTPASQQGWQNDIWRRWGFGSSQGVPYADALFPTVYFDTFTKYYPYIGSSSDSYSEGVKAVIDSTQGKVWLLAHSAGASRAVTAARGMALLVNGLILIEPAGPPDANDFPDLNGMHMLGVYGDYITSRNQTNRKLSTETAAGLFKNNGGIAEVVSLPEDSMVKGNSHIMMQDSNSAYIQGIISLWLKQFSTASIHRISSPQSDVKLYPNPSGVSSQVWIQALDKILSYTLYSLEGKKIRSVVGLNSGQIALRVPANSGIYILEVETKKGRVAQKVWVK